MSKNIKMQFIKKVGGGMGGVVMGIKESTCDEHQVMYGIVESLFCTPETNIPLFFNFIKFINLKIL